MDDNFLTPKQATINAAAYLVFNFIIAMVTIYILFVTARTALNMHWRAKKQKISTDWKVNPRRHASHRADNEPMRTAPITNK